MVVAGNKPQKKICGAKAKSTGKPCGRTAGWGTDHVGKGRCKLHGGSSTGPKTAEGKARSSRNSMKHGAYIEHLLTDDERVVYSAFSEATIEKYELDKDDPIHMSILHRAVITYIKIMRVDLWEMEAQHVPIEKVNHPNTGEEVLVPESIFDEHGERVGEKRVETILIRSRKDFKTWETHFQKYITMLGVDRATIQRREMEKNNHDKTIDAFAWLWGNKQEEAI